MTQGCHVFPGHHILLGSIGTPLWESQDTWELPNNNQEGCKVKWKHKNKLAYFTVSPCQTLTDPFFKVLLRSSFELNRLCVNFCLCFHSLLTTTYFVSELFEKLHVAFYVFPLTSFSILTWKRSLQLMREIKEENNFNENDINMHFHLWLSKAKEMKCSIFQITIMGWRLSSDTTAQPASPFLDAFWFLLFSPLSLLHSSSVTP